MKVGDKVWVFIPPEITFFFFEYEEDNAIIGHSESGMMVRLVLPYPYFESEEEARKYYSK